VPPRPCGQHQVRCCAFHLLMLLHAAVCTVSSGERMRACFCYAALYVHPIPWHASLQVCASQHRLPVCGRRVAPAGNAGAEPYRALITAERQRRCSAKGPICVAILVYVRTLSGDCDGDCYLMSLRTSRSGPQCQWLSLVGHCQQTVHRVTPTSVCFTTPVQPQHGRCAALEGWQLAVACLDVMLQMRGYVWWKLICALGEHGCIDDCCFVRRRWCQTQAIFRYANQHAELRCSLSCSQPCPCTPERAKFHRAVSGRAIHPGSRCLCCRPHT
jgi:hypothetical protein